MLSQLHPLIDCNPHHRSTTFNRRPEADLLPWSTDYSARISPPAGPSPESVVLAYRKFAAVCGTPPPGGGPIPQERRSRISESDAPSGSSSGKHITSTRHIGEEVMPASEGNVQRSPWRGITPPAEDQTSCQGNREQGTKSCHTQEIMIAHGSPRSRTEANR